MTLEGLEWSLRAYFVLITLELEVNLRLSTYLLRVANNAFKFVS